MWVKDCTLFFSIACIAGIYIVYLLIKRLTGKMAWHHKGSYYETADGYFTFPNIKESPTVKLSVIVPAYNEEERLPVMLDETIEYLEERQSIESSFLYEIIVVDDGSKDQTFKVAMDYSKKYGSEKIRVLQMPQNRGKGAAVKKGMLGARGELLLMVDADGATRFADLQKLEVKMKSFTREPNSMAIVVGSRAHLEKEAIASRSLFRTFLMKGFHLIVWFLCARSVRDSQCGFKLFTRSAAHIVFLNQHVERWAFDVELLYIAEELGIPIAEVAVKWTEIAGSKIVPVFSWIQMGKDILLIWLQYRLGIWKIKKQIE